MDFQSYFIPTNIPPTPLPPSTLHQPPTKPQPSLPNPHSPTLTPIPNPHPLQPPTKFPPTPPPPPSASIVDTTDKKEICKKAVETMNKELKIMMFYDELAEPVADVTSEKLIKTCQFLLVLCFCFFFIVFL